jgi:hypothetical protein
MALESSFINALHDAIQKALQETIKGSLNGNSRGALQSYLRHALNFKGASEIDSLPLGNRHGRKLRKLP